MWITKPFQNWKKAVQKMKAHASSEFHVRQVEAELLANRRETVVQRFGDSERNKNRKGIKALLRCTHYLCKQHIPHITNFSKLIALIAYCGGHLYPSVSEIANAFYKNGSSGVIVWILSDDRLLI